jgi:hypothetical protein
MFENQPRDQDELGAEAVLAFRDQHATWMCVGTHTVVSTIIGWMAYGKGWRKKMGGQPSIRWAENGEALFHNGERIMVDDFTRTLRGQVVEAQKLLGQLFGGTWEKVSQKINMGRIADSMVRLGAGQSFATNPKNDWLEPGPATQELKTETGPESNGNSIQRKKGANEQVKRIHCTPMDLGHPQILSSKMHFN